MSWDSRPQVLQEWIERHLRVQSATVGSESVPMVLQRGQVQALQQEVLQQLGAAWWLITIKCRQSGSSTLWLCVLAALCCLCPGISCAVVAPDDVIEEALAVKWRIIWESARDSLGGNCPEVIRKRGPTQLLDNGSRLVFMPCGRSRARAGRLSIGDTLHFVVLSELAKWPYAGASMGSLVPTLRRTRASVVVDSTAPDVAGAGEEYLAVARAALLGETPRRSVFFWHWGLVPEYRLTVPVPAVDYTEREQELAGEHGLDGHQIAWRRETHALPELTKIASVIYPESPLDALSPQVESAFSDDAMERLRGRRSEDFPEPLSPAEVHEALPAGLQAQEPLRDLFCQPKWGDRCPRGRGYVRAWELPVLGRQYVIGVDPSEGKKRGDWQVSVCLDVLSAELCAVIRTRINPVLHASLLVRLAELYGALIEIEMSSSGPGMIWYMCEATIPTAELAVFGAHATLQRQFPRQRVKRRQPTREHRVSRQEAFIDWVNAGREIRDPDLRQEIVDLDPETREKPRVKGTSDDYLDALGIAEHRRQRLVMVRGGESRGIAGYGTRPRLSASWRG